MHPIRSICIYCGSQPGNDQTFVNAAETVGNLLGKAQVRLIYGGGTTGIMGAVSRSVRDNGGQVTGIIPDFLTKHELVPDVEPIGQEMIVTSTMHERKRNMFELSDAFLALPGGIGTLEEVIEIMTWAQLGQHSKPVGFLNVEGFWNPLLDLFDHMKKHGFIHTDNRVQPVIINEPGQVLESLAIAG